MTDDFQDFSPRRVQFIHWIAGAALLVILGLTGWSYLEKSRLNQALVEVESETVVAQKQLDQLRADRVDSLVLAQTTLANVEASAIEWSQVITNLIAVTPLDIFYRSYSASQDGGMSVSVLTDSYDSAAQLISVLDQDKHFNHVFVSSLSEGDSEGGSSAVVSFGITFNVR